MKFPEINQEHSRAHKITGVTGTASAIHPAFHSIDRLQDSLNVFNKDGILTNRNGFLKTCKDNLVDFTVSSTKEQVFFADFPFTEIDGYNTLAVLTREEVFSNTTLDFFVLDDFGNMKKLFYHEIVSATGHTTFEIINAFFIKSSPLSESGLFLLIPLIRTDLKTGVVTKELRCFEFTTDYSSLVFVDMPNLYRPLIMKHGHGNRFDLATDIPVKETQYPEGVNILNGSFEAAFTADGYSDTFKLPVSLKELYAIIIRYYTSDDSYMTFVIPATSTVSPSLPFLDIQLSFKTDRATGTIQAVSQNGAFALPRNKLHNSLKIYAYTDTGNKAFSLFGHRAKPIVSDQRIFLAGGEGTENKIYYSGKNEHLYYSEENSFSVGDSLDKVTALSKQGRYIVAFKENELYRITVSESKAVNRATLVDDDSVKKVPQPDKKVVRINDSIGCDRPATVKNCSNRLVWYHSNGCVYTLYGSNLYTEGSVYELAGEIKDKLKSLSDEDKEYIRAIEVHGRYALATNKSIFIMDSQVSGFAYLLGHKNPNKSYGGLPWFHWRLPDSMNLLCSYSRKGEDYFILRSDDYIHYDIAHLTGSLDTVYVDGVEKTQSPVFFFNTALIGEDQKKTEKISFSASFNEFAQATIYDINGDKVTLPVMNHKKFKLYHIPLKFPSGKLGIKFKGSGEFSLHYIKCLVKN